MAQGNTQGSRNGKYGVFYATGESMGWKEYSVQTLVSPKEGSLHVRSVGTGIDSHLTRIGSRIIMG